MALNTNTSCLCLGAIFCFLGTTAITLVLTLHVSGYSSGASPSVELCIPKLSIRCEPDDCGSMFVRCGRSEKRQEVPANKVCYNGALISTNSRMHNSGLLPHNCRERTSHSRNSTTKFDLKACNCPALCSGSSRCTCYCKSGSAQKVTCLVNGVKKTYANQAQADCCLGSGNCASALQSKSRNFPWSWWTEAVEFGKIVIRSWLKRICDFMRERCTFPPPPLDADECCAAQSGCNQC
ncbi:hypothetical protein MPTK1_7g08260 [Marchantia polymorpha subsp. ruderalis]|uniref:Uncharacterized protein n=2 Tax=Marchantia polymorpha TaxID=3197 RepID=A0AAF6BXC3_MARPO|nr:hypothetical protein MARPO_0146s0026 [Marchantia polymorpha]BBN16657.1 hypothetical protein Mp_7g08260 [Marchantia polymorpha subsp. ruderalis]|eukprot:PTQ29204.1 hypothetical protein MARPO_0146s0026 [Marchantia polymorpha]